MDHEPATQDLPGGSQAGSPDEERLTEILEDYLAAVEAGRAPDRDGLLAQHPDFAPALARCLDGLNSVRRMVRGDSMASSGSSPPSSMPVPQKFGDFQIIREIGRGGMGVVYLAEQVSLHRQVALKVLPLAAVMDPRQLQRFRNEVQAAALLQHTHIVPIYSVGSDRGIHYYAMQYVDGSTLAEIIGLLRQERGLDEVPRHPDAGGGRLDEINAVLTRDFMPAGASPHCRPRVLRGGVETGVGAGEPLPQTETLAVLSTTLSSGRRSEFFRAVVRLVIQAAEALDHAHSRGVLHRDVKPGNLMVDAIGNVFVTDFGLARLQTDPGITSTGDVVGTLRYMSPEQALAKHVVVDHRTDIYSLGATLYELLALQPAYQGHDRQHLMRQIAFEEPRRLRSLDPAIPTDLETITLKAMEKDPCDRYETALEMAEDLRRFLENRSIHARRPSLSSRVAKWSRRHVGVVWVLLLSSVALVAALLVSTSLIAASRSESDKQRLQADMQRHTAILERNNARRNLYHADMVAGQMDLQTRNHAGLVDRLVNHLPIPGDDDCRGWEWYYMVSRCRPETRTLVYPVFSPFTYWSPDGKYLGSPGAIWDVETGEQVRRFDTSGVHLGLRGAWSPDGQRFAWCTAADENALYVWDRGTSHVKCFRGHQSSVWSVAWSPDGSRIASGSNDRTIKIWNVATGTLQWTSPNIDAEVPSLAWSPDGALLAAGLHFQKGFQVWDVARGEIITSKNFGEAMYSVNWHPEGMTLAVCGNSSWSLFRRDDWSAVHEAKLSRGGAIAYSPNGLHIAVADGESVAVWDASGKTLVAELKGHRDPIVSVSWNPDSRQLVTADAVREIKLWDLDSPAQPPPIHTGMEIDSIMWDADNRTLVTVARADGALARWNTDTGSLQRRETLAVKPPFLRSPDRRLAAVRVEQAQTLNILEADSGATRAVLRLESQGLLCSYTFSPDGSSMLLEWRLDPGRRLEFWDVEREQCTATWNTINPRIPFSQFLWTPDGTLVVAVGWGDEGNTKTVHWQDHLHLFDTSKAERILQYRPGVRGRVTSLAWNCNGKSLCVGTDEGRLEVLDVGTRRARFGKKLSEHGIAALAWHPDGSRLACGTLGGQVIVVDSAAGDVYLYFEVTERPLTHLAWSGNGQRLAAATTSGEIRVWDASRGYSLAADGPRCGELAWAYQRRFMMSAGDAGAIQSFLHYAPDTRDFWEWRGSALARLGRYHEAYQEYSKGVEPDMPFAFNAAVCRACALLGAGEMDRYRKACAQLVEVFCESPVPLNRGDVAWLCTLTSNRFVDWKQVREMARISDREGHNPGGYEQLLTLGASHYRAGDLDTAISVLTELAANLEKGGDTNAIYYTACAKYFLALARLEMGHRSISRRLLDEANQTKVENQPFLSHWGWMRPVVLATLRDEVEGRLQDSPRDTDVN